VPWYDDTGGETVHKLTRLADRKMAKGKRLQAVFLLILQRLLTPTPAMGFLLGSMITLFLAPVVVLRFEWTVAALTFGVIITVCAAAFQRLHDNYWEKQE